jgi:hypothetical protein
MTPLVRGGCVRIEPGHQGVLWMFFGGTQPETYGEGIHVVWPLNKMIIYDVRVQERLETVAIRTRLPCRDASLHVSVRYRACARLRATD